MYVIGLVGGVASGKSLVAECFAKLSAEIIDADRLAHAALSEPQVIDAARTRWGRDIVGADDRIDRGALAEIVFAAPPVGPRELAFLESLVHPRVRLRVDQRLAELARRADCRAAVLDAPLILEAGWGPLCDWLVFVAADRPQRLARAQRRGWSERQFAAREAAQWPLEKKKRRCHVVIDNSGAAADTSDQVQRFWRRIDSISAGSGEHETSDDAR
jgi:dephospho-CoA kinase